MSTTFSFITWQLDAWIAIASLICNSLHLSKNFRPDKQLFSKLPEAGFEPLTFKQEGLHRGRTDYDLYYRALNSKSVPDLLVRVVLLSTNDAFEPLGAAFPSLFRRSCNKSWLLSQKGERSTCPEIRYFAMVRYSTKLYIPSTIKIKMSFELLLFLGRLGGRLGSTENFCNSACKFWL